MRKIIKTTETPAKTFKAGSILFQEGDKGDSFYLIRTGKVGVFKGFNKPGQVQLATVGENKVLGEIAALDGRPRTATAVTLTDVVLVEIPAATLKQEVSQCATWLQTIIFDLVERLRSTADVLSKNGISNDNAHAAKD